MPFGPQKNLVTDFGASGAGHYVTHVVSIANGSKSLTVSGLSSALFVSGDVGLYFWIDGGGGGVDNNLFTSITVVGSFSAGSQTITLNDAASVTLVSESHTFAWGPDDSTAFAAMRTFALGQLPLGMDLLIPAGVYAILSNDPNINRWCRGITNFRVTGQGTVVIVGAGSLGAGFVYPTQETMFPVTALVHPVNAGSQGVTLSDPTQYTRFQPGNTYTLSDTTVYTAGTVAIMRCYDMQGFGDANNFYHDFVDITSVSTTTGAITFAAPLRHDYNRNFPVFVTGGPFAANLGGPPTLFMPDAAWNCTQQFINLGFWNPQQQINATGRNMTYTNVKHLSQLGLNYSVCENITIDGLDFTTSHSTGIEVDKTITNMTMINSTGHVWWLQSSSVEYLNIFNSTLDRLRGTARVTTIDNCNIGSLEIGPTGYGRTDFLKCTNSIISAVSQSEFAESAMLTSPSIWSIQDGVIRGTGTGSPIRWGFPGTVMFIMGQSGSIMGALETSYVVGDGTPTVASSVSFVGTNQFVPPQASPTTWPTIPLLGGNDIVLTMRPSLLYFNNCVGCDLVVDLCNPGAQMKPWGVYSKRQYTGNTLPAAVGTTVIGKVQAINIAVSTPYAGPTVTPITLSLGQFHPSGRDDSGVSLTWNIGVDLKAPGTRSITPGGVTGAQPNDTDLTTMPVGTWFSGISAYINTDISGESPAGWPVVTIEVITDQGIKPSVVPMPMRLRA